MRQIDLFKIYLTQMKNFKETFRENNTSGLNDETFMYFQEKNRISKAANESE